MRSYAQCRVMHHVCVCVCVSERERERERERESEREREGHITVDSAVLTAACVLQIQTSIITVSDSVPLSGLN